MSRAAQQLTVSPDLVRAMGRKHPPLPARAKAAAYRDVRVPAGDWKPREDQRALWKAWIIEGRLDLFAMMHRRWGKDEVALHGTCVKMHERVGTYWHMLPEAAQARKAIWDAINPRTSRRRIDEAFPIELRASTRENDMFIRMRSGSTWQVVGSDNFDSLVGSPPVGLVKSEWALANPRAGALLRPILAENKGWDLKITTPRGNNHAVKTYKAMVEAMKTDPTVFAQRLTVAETHVLDDEQLSKERAYYHTTFGPEEGDALYLQEWFCDFEAAVPGSYYGGFISRARADGRIAEFPPDPRRKVHTAWDLGFSDQTAIWLIQRDGFFWRVVGYIASSSQTIGWYADQLHSWGAMKGCSFGTHLIPHDGAAKGHSALVNGEALDAEFRKQGVLPTIVPRDQNILEGIAAARAVLPLCRFDEQGTTDGVEALSLYRREWDDDLQKFKDAPLHDWTSHGADAFRTFARGVRLIKDTLPGGPANAVGDLGAKKLAQRLNVGGYA